MKHITLLVLTTVLSVALIASCALKPQVVQTPIVQTPIKHQLEITVNSETAAELELKEKKTPIEILNGANEELSMLSFIADGRLHSFLYSGLSTSDLIRLKKDMTKVEDKTDIRKMLLFINSPGGDAFVGLGIADVINDAQALGWEIEAYATGIVASAALPIFITSYPRTATEGTLFMIHEAALWKWPGQEKASDIRAQSELMVYLQERYILHLTENSNIKDKKKWIKKEKKTTWFTAKQALEWGLVDEVR